MQVITINSKPNSDSSASHRAWLQDQLGVSTHSKAISGGCLLQWLSHLGDTTSRVRVPASSPGYFAFKPASW